MNTIQLPLILSAALLNVVGSGELPSGFSSMPAEKAVDVTNISSTLQTPSPINFPPLSSNVAANPATYLSPNPPSHINPSLYNAPVNHASYQRPYAPLQAVASGSAATYPTPYQQPPSNASGPSFGPALQSPGGKILDDEMCIQMTDSAEAFRLNSFGVRFGAFAFRNDIGNQVYGTFPTIGLELKRHMGESLFALSTSVDFAGGEGEPITFNATGNSDINVFSWRVTALLEPKPGTWGSVDKQFYFNPYIGIGLGYHMINENISVSSFGQSVSGSGNFGGVGGHAIIGADFVIKRKFSLGFAFLSTVVSNDSGWQGDTDLGGDTFFFTLDGRF